MRAASRSIGSSAPMEVGRFLCLAIAIVEGLGKVHQHGLVHKDIKPANILINPVNDEVRFTGFGIASRFARERQSPHPPETIAGTLAYMAPEQTGRMNRSIDFPQPPLRPWRHLLPNADVLCRLPPPTPWNGCTAISPGGR